MWHSEDGVLGAETPWWTLEHELLHKYRDSAFVQFTL
jgi:hypothetical protein